METGKNISLKQMMERFALELLNAQHTGFTRLAG